MKVMTVAKQRLKSGRERKGYCVREICCCWVVPVGLDQDAEILLPPSVKRAISNGHVSDNIAKPRFFKFSRDSWKRKVQGPSTLGFNNRHKNSDTVVSPAAKASDGPRQTSK